MNAHTLTHTRPSPVPRDTYLLKPSEIGTPVIPNVSQNTHRRWGTDCPQTPA